VNATLELLKAGRLALRVEGDDLAVEHERFLALTCPLSQGGGDFRELARFLVPSRDHNRTTPPGSISAIARMPSYFGS
jgi:hypothetical protein